MTRVRILVRQLPGCEASPPHFTDCEAFLVHGDGLLERVTNVEAVSIKVERGQPVRACIRLVNVEVDAIVDAEIQR